MKWFSIIRWIVHPLVVHRLEHVTVWSMGIPYEGPVYILGDNQSVLANTTIPDSTLKKKSQSIAYHFVREGSARDEWRTSYISTHDNESDLLTKVLPNGEKRRHFVN